MNGEKSSQANIFPGRGTVRVNDLRGHWPACSLRTGAKSACLEPGKRRQCGHCRENHCPLLSWDSVEGPGAAGQGNEGAPGADSQKRVPADQPTEPSLGVVRVPFLLGHGGC